MRAEPGEHRTDGVAVADDHPVDAADLARLGLDAEPAGRADQGERRLGPGQVTSSADERPGSVSEPCARNAPRHAASASQDGAADDLRRQAAHRAAAVSIRPVWRASASPSWTTRTT